MILELRGLNCRLSHMVLEDALTTHILIYRLKPLQPGRRWKCVPWCLSNWKQLQTLPWRWPTSTASTAPSNHQKESESPFHQRQPKARRLKKLKVGHLSRVTKSSNKMCPKVLNHNVNQILISLNVFLEYVSLFVLKCKFSHKVPSLP